LERINRKNIYRCITRLRYITFENKLDFFKAMDAYEREPELLKALRATIPAMGVDISGIDIGAVIQQARSAIAKATGKETT